MELNSSLVLWDVAVSDKLLRSSSDDFMWPLEYSVAYGRFLVEIEFHDLKVASSHVSFSSQILYHFHSLLIVILVCSK